MLITPFLRVIPTLRRTAMPACSFSSSSNLSIKERLKKTVKVYGVTATIFHSTLYVCSLSTVYVGVRNGLDAHGLLTSWGVDPSVIPEGAGEVAAAWCITAVTGPARGVLTIVGTPVIAKWWKERSSSSSSSSGSSSKNKLEDE